MKSFLLLPVLLLFAVTSKTNAQIALPVSLTDSVWCTPVKDQAQSPTCWVFGTNSLFESDLAKQYGKQFDLSEMFIARHAYIDKAKVYVASKGKTYAEGGGQFHDVLRVIEKYGMMPESAYTGKPANHYSHNHAKLDTSMKYLLKKWVKEKKPRLNEKDVQQLNDTLDKYMGRVPASFSYLGKLYTPKTYAAEIVKFKNEYVELMSFADLPYYKKSLLKDKFNWAGDSLYNVPLADLQLIVDSALAKGWTVGWEGDVTEKGFNYMSGYAYLADSAYELDKQRLKDFKSEQTERDHMLHLVGAGTNEEGKKWYYLKNSWGTWMSRYKGYMYMNENFFNLKTVIIMVNKEALPASLLKRLQLKNKDH